MTDKILILGELSEAINYNLNNQHLTLKKLIITPKFIDEGLKNTTLQELKQKNQAELSSLEINFKDAFYHTIQENLKKISSVYVDTKIDKMSLVNSLSNSKFNIILRTESYSITKYFVEASSTLGYIRKLLKENYSLSINQNLENIESFQIEIVESEDIEKSIILKKENTKFSLACSYGVYESESGIDNLIEPEIYISENTLFSHYKPNQKYALFREANKIVKKEINTPEKILNQEELKTISAKTKDLNNVYVKLYITNKGAIRISNLSLLENDIYEFTKYGFFINKNSIETEKISLVNLEDNLEIEYPYYKYLTIYNLEEFNYFLQNFNKYTSQNKFNYDGIILNFNIHNKILDYFGILFGINIIFYQESLENIKNVKLTKPIILEEINSSNNVFNNFNSSNNTLSDENFERLKNLGTSNVASNTASNLEQTSLNQNPNQNQNYNQTFQEETQIQPQSQAQFQTETQTETQTELQVQNNFVTNSKEYENNLNNNQNQLNNQGENMAYSSAIDFFMNKVAETSTKKEQREQEEKQAKEQPRVDNTNVNQSNNYHNQQNNQNTQSNQNNQTNNSQINDNFLNQITQSINSANTQNTQNIQNNNTQNNNSNQTQNPSSNFNNNYQNIANSINEKLNFGQTNQNNQNSSLNINSNLNNNQANNSQIIENKINLQKYENCLAIDLITLPNLEGDKYFLNEKNFNLNKKGFVLINSKEDFEENEKLDFILPYTNEENEKFYYLVNSSENFFNLDGIAKGYFVNLSQLNNQIRENFIKNLYTKTNNIYLILRKEDINIVENIVNLIQGIYITDLQNSQEFEQLKNTLLKFEKKALINLLNEKI